MPTISARVTSGALPGSNVALVPAPTGISGNFAMVPVRNLSITGVALFERRDAPSLSPTAPASAPMSPATAKSKVTAVIKGGRLRVSGPMTRNGSLRGRLALQAPGSHGRARLASRDDPQPQADRDVRAQQARAHRDNARRDPLRRTHCRPSPSAPRVVANDQPPSDARPRCCREAPQARVPRPPQLTMRRLRGAASHAGRPSLGGGTPFWGTVSTTSELLGRRRRGMGGLPARRVLPNPSDPGDPTRKRTRTRESRQTGGSLDKPTESALPTESDRSPPLDPLADPQRGEFCEFVRALDQGGAVRRLCVSKFYRRSSRISSRVVGLRRTPHSRRRWTRQSSAFSSLGGSGCAWPAANAAPRWAPTREIRRRRRSARRTRAGLGRCRA